MLAIRSMRASRDLSRSVNNHMPNGGLIAAPCRQHLRVHDERLMSGRIAAPKDEEKINDHTS
jgi:hypothetical protein